jgi:tetratricopeptide (TPR) repeat protein/predicted Ser/Thr protein kinase
MILEELPRRMILDPRQAESFAKDLLALDEPDDAAPIPARLPDGYTLLAPLGVGGMGVVYHARHIASGREVAVKMLRASLATEETARRLTREARILQKLQHPGIARLLHAGWTGHGAAREPYAIIEYVAGPSLMRACADRAWDRPQRLTVFLAVCDAVAYAHRKGVIHRDLKPGNILVGEGGLPKVVDFGLASLTEPDAATRLTISGQVMGTLPYIAPEQLEHETDAADTRGDVYALGVILHELLTGKPLVDVASLPAALAIQRLREAEHADPAAADPSLRGDLATIILRSTARDPDHRYQTVDELAGDLRRFLADEPILARRPTMRQRARRFVKRNPALIAGCVVAVVACVALVWQARRAADQAKTLTVQAESRAAEADRARSVAEAVSTLMNEMVLSPGVEGLGREARVADVLDTAARRLDTDPPRYPEVEFAVARTLTVAYRDLALHERAVCYAERAVQAGERAFGPQSAAKASGLIELARAHEEAGAIDRALDAADDAVRVAEASAEPAAITDALLVRGRLLVGDGRADDAEPLLDRAQRLAARTPEPADRAAAATVELARLALSRRASATALSMIDSLALPEPGVGTPVAHRADAVRIKIESLAALSRFDEAFPLAKAELAWHEARLPAGHPSLVRARAVLASVLVAMGRAREGAPLADNAAAAALAALGPTHPATLDAAEAAAAAWRAAGDPDLALTALDRVLDALSERDPTHLAAVIQLRKTQIAGSCDTGDFARADELLNQTQRAVMALEPLGPSIRARAARLLEACEVLRESRPR